MPTELSIGRAANGFVVRIVGRGTMQESAALRAAIEPRLDAGPVLLDATKCDYVDSTFLGSLVAIKKACQHFPNRAFLIAASTATRARLFATSALDRYFDFVDDCPALLEEPVKVDVAKLDGEALGRHVLRCHELLAERGGHEAKAFQAIADRLAKELGEKAP